MLDKARDIRALLDELEAKLYGYPHLLAEVIQRLVRRVVSLIERFRAEPENRDGRGVTVKAGNRSKTVLKRLANAVDAAVGHADGNVRREARRAIRFTLRAQNLEQLEECLKHLQGSKMKAARRRNEQLARESAWRMHLPDGAEIVAVTTVSRLRSVGRQLNLCVAKGDSIGKDYHDRLRSGDSRFYTLACEGVVLYLMEVDVETGTVSEISAKSNGELALSRRRALDLLEALDATADDVDAFAEVGAFSPYLFQGKPDEQLQLNVNGHDYRVHAFTGKRQMVVVLRVSAKRKRVRACSLFERKAPLGKGLAEWDHVSWGRKYFGMGQFAALLSLPKVSAMVDRLFD